MSHKLLKPQTITLPFPPSQVAQCLTIIHLTSQQIELQGPIADLAYCEKLLEYGLLRLRQHHRAKQTAEQLMQAEEGASA